MLTANRNKLINSLTNKKHRQEHQLFIAEGEKCVQELLASTFTTKFLYHTADWQAPEMASEPEEIQLITDRELKKISALKTPNKVLAVASIPEETDYKKLSYPALVLDNIQDPGNLGTIIRIADWFGINQIVCSTNSVDVYNPKVIQATMGSVFRRKVLYANLELVLKHCKKSKATVYGTYMDGESLYEVSLDKNCVIVLGSESHGISSEIGEIIDRKLSVPSFSKLSTKAESLNVSTAAAMVCYELFRPSR